MIHALSLFCVGADLMIFSQVTLASRMVEKVSEVGISQAVVRGNVVWVPLFEKLALAVFTGLGGEHFGGLKEDTFEK